MTAGPTPPFAQVTLPPPAPGPSNGWGVRVVAGVVGAVVGAVIVGGTWLMVESRSGGFDSSTEPVTAPDRVGIYPRFAEAEINQQPKAKANLDRVRSWNARSAERLAASYDGAAVAIETYSDDGLENMFTLQVVRATSPFPVYVPYLDPKVLGVVRPHNDEARFGEVSCSVTNDTTRAGQRPEPDSVHVAACRRTGRGLTVEITNVTGDLGHRPDQVAALVDDAWSQSI